MTYSEKDVFELLGIIEQKQVEYFLKETEHDLPNWLIPTEEDYANVNFAFRTILRFDDNVELATESYNLALQKSREATEKIFQKRKKEKENDEILTLDDFDGNWGKFKNYLDERYESDIAEQKKIWRETFHKYLRQMINPNTGEIMRLQ